MKGQFSKTMLGVVAAATLVAGPAAANDLIYRHRPMQHLSVLKGYNNQPYWRVLSECAGIYGGLANHYQTSGDRRLDAAKSHGVRFLNAATWRLQRDRGLNPQQALDLAREPVETGRVTVSQLLGQESPRDRSHEQMIEMFCSQVMDAHDSALRFR